MEGKQGIKGMGGGRGGEGGGGGEGDEVVEDGYVRREAMSAESVRGHKSNDSGDGNSRCHLSGCQPGIDARTKVHEHEKIGRMNVRQASSQRGHGSKTSDLQDEWQQSVDQALRTGLEEGCIAPARPALQNYGRNAGLGAEQGRTEEVVVLCEVINLVLRSAGLRVELGPTTGPQEA